MIPTLGLVGLAGGGPRRGQEAAERVTAAGKAQIGGIGVASFAED